MNSTSINDYVRYQRAKLRQHAKESTASAEADLLATIKAAEAILEEN